MSRCPPRSRRFVLSSTDAFGAIIAPMTHLASFLDKFEEHFGSAWTRALLVLVGLAGVSACGFVLWFALLAPVLGMILRSGPPGSAAEIAKLVSFLLIAALGLGFGVNVAGKYLDWAISAHLLEQTREAKRAVVEAERRLAITEGQLATSENRAAAAEACVEQLFARALESKMLTPRQIETLSKAARIEAQRMS